MANMRESHVGQVVLKEAKQVELEKRPELSKLGAADFAEVMKGLVSLVDNGDWLQPIYRWHCDDWVLCGLEVLYRLDKVDGIPFPAFVNFVTEATDQSKSPNEEFREIFRQYALGVLMRMDSLLSQLTAEQQEVMVSNSVKISVNFTAKQLDACLGLELANRNLLVLEETEYDAEPENVSVVRGAIWQQFGHLVLDDLAMTLREVQDSAESPFEYAPPMSPYGKPYKPLQQEQQHDLACARRFIADFKEVRRSNPEAKSTIKIGEELCCYLIGVGYAPFARQSMATWREENPVASAAVRRAGAALFGEIMEAGMDIVLEVSFQDDEVQWLYDEVPDLKGRIMKQGGLSGATALPSSLLGPKLLRVSQDD